MGSRGIGAASRLKADWEALQQGLLAPAELNIDTASTVPLEK